MIIIFRLFFYFFLFINSLLGGDSPAYCNSDLTRFEKSCNDGDARACYNIGFFYELGKGVKQDFKIAADFYQRACNGNDAYGCFRMGFKHERGEGVAQDFKKSASFYQKACDSGISERACYNLGNLYSKGKGVGRDIKKAKKYLSIACGEMGEKNCKSYKILNEQGI